MELFELSHRFSKCLLVGDFNARTGSEDDFIFVPDSESHVVDIENIQINAVCNLDQYDFSRKRNSRDKNKNRFGNQLLEFCKGNNFFIMNGRTLGDIDGKFTCRNSSVVDYCLCSAELIQNFTDFKVLDFSSLYSDVHSPIEISLKQTDQEVSTKCSDDTRTNEQKINNWTNEKSHKFLECLNLTEIENINSEIDGTTVVTQETVDMIISKIGKVLINSAGNTFGFKVSAGKKSEHRKNKPWFDHDCKAARSEFRKMKRNKNKSPFHRALVSDAEKRYKNTMNKAHKKYRSDFRKKMDDLKQKDAKEFWRLLNENKSTAQPKIDFDKLVSYFKELNSDLRDDTEEQQIEKNTEYCFEGGEADLECPDGYLIDINLGSLHIQLLSIFSLQRMEGITKDPCDSFYCANGGMCKLGSDLEPMCQCLGDWNGTRCDAPCVLETCPIGFKLLPNQASSTNCYSDSGASPANNRQWNQALVTCAMTPGAYLWRPNTVQEAAAVRNEFNLPNDAYVWTGAIDGTFIFAIENGPFAFGALPFGTGTADPAVGTDCVGIRFNSATWVWSDQLCTNIHRYICEYPRRVCP
ncbi:unnamed protein product [Mytilus edulis]|uniref:Uncharacterized protein n=1 Tax=Mytilus edulis TaxID=6550 RepID=A0A8S3S9K5_MYTED|nr:unnamed protein product [Mytilus edulis]